MANRFEKSGITGKIVERELFGKSLHSKYEQNEEVGGYWERYDFERRLEILKRLQPFQSIEAAPDFAKTVHTLASDKLKIDPKVLRFFTAVESPVDWMNKIDGWFEIKIKDGPMLRVTIDITTNPEKALPKYPADIPDFLVPSDGLDRKVDENQFLEYSNSLADEVVMILRPKLSPFIKRR